MNRLRAVNSGQAGAEGKWGGVLACRPCTDVLSLYGRRQCPQVEDCPGRQPPVVEAASSVRQAVEEACSAPLRVEEACSTLRVMYGATGGPTSGGAPNFSQQQMREAHILSTDQQPRIKGNRTIVLSLQTIVLRTTDVLKKKKEVENKSRGQNVETVQAQLKTRKLSQITSR